MADRRPGLWAEIALALALLSLATILLNAALFWLLGNRLELERRTDLALSSGRSLRAQLESADPEHWKRIVRAYGEGGLELSELYVVDEAMKEQAVVAGAPPSVPDASLREALYMKGESFEVQGPWFGQRSVVVTEPLVVGGRVHGALRLGVALPGGGPVSPGLGFVLGFTVLSATMVALFGYALFRRRLIQPVTELQDATQRIAGGDFGYTTELDAASELQELSGALNVLSVSLDSYRQRTAEQVKSLEQANVELQKVQEELIRSEKLASVGRLAAGIAHEVGNPLAAVLGYLEVLDQGVEPELERELLGRARIEVDRIHIIIRQLLDYARPGEGQRDLVSARAMLEEAVATVRPQPAFKELTLSVDADPELPLIRVDGDKLHQVFVNLLLNAADAVGGEGRVMLSAAVEGGELCIRCEDSGGGIAAEDLSKVFEPFFTTKEPGAGTGLGLAMCLRIVEGEGGWIRAENVPGGARVTLGLPL